MLELLFTCVPFLGTFITILKDKDQWGPEREFEEVKWMKKQVYIIREQFLTNHQQDKINEWKGRTSQKHLLFSESIKIKRQLILQGSEGKECYILNISGAKDFRRIWALFACFLEMCQEERVHHLYMQNFNQNRSSAKGNIKGAGLPFDIYLTLLERKYTLARAFRGEKNVSDFQP